MVANVTIDTNTLSIKNKTKLSIDIVNALLLKNYTLSDIARVCNINASSVSRYIQRHYDDIAPIGINDDSLLIAKSKRIVNNGFDKINNIYASNDFNKTDLKAIAVTTGITFDKMRILQGKSTENVEIHSVRSNRKEVQNELQDLRHRRKLQEADVNVT